MRRAFLVALACGVAAVSGGPAAADDARTCGNGIVDPVPLPLRDGGYDATRAACLRSEVDVRSTGRWIDDALVAALQVAVRVAETRRFEWTASAQLLERTPDELRYGPIALAGVLGGHAGGLRVAGLLRVELPLTRSDLDGTSAGGQLAGLVLIPAHPRIALHLRAGVLGAYATGSEGTTTEGAVIGSLDAGVLTLPWLRLFAGVEAQAGWSGGVDHVVARVAAHWRVYGPWRIDAGVGAPLAGDEAADAVGTVAVRYDR